MSDPAASQDDGTPLAPPPRPLTQQTHRPTQMQIEQDERYARQLARHYESQGVNASNPHAEYSSRGIRPEQQSPNQMGYYEEDRERSFIDGRYAQHVQL